jgi:hypothetical protein
MSVRCQPQGQENIMDLHIASRIRSALVRRDLVSAVQIIQIFRP